MKILALDTSTSILSAAVCHDDAIWAEYTIDCGRTHAERAIDFLDILLCDAGLKLADLDALAVSHGPGSFTGVRVGVSLCKGLALANGLPLYGVPTLDAMARGFGLGSGSLCVMLDAKMSEVFGAAFRFDGSTRVKTCTDQAVAPERLAGQMKPGTVFMGDGAVLYAEQIREACSEAVVLPMGLSIPRASMVGFEAIEMARNGDPGDAAAVAPVYLRPSQAEQLYSRMGKQ
ncbi:MAG: tRNA (adenosine(37)-N6)-threonylcarbamoyltransferase complex dimerization subunit type 1 TsaB [Candidatus Hydrogenedentota bacterium]